jgi:hypothetical protein
MLFRELIAVFCEHHMGHTYSVGRMQSFYVKADVHIVTTGFKRVKDHVMKTYKYHTFLTSARYGGEWSASLSGHFTSAKGSRYSFMDGAQSRYGRCGKENNFIPPPEVELRFLGYLTSSLIAISTELFRL